MLCNIYTDTHMQLYHTIFLNIENRIHSKRRGHVKIFKNAAIYTYLLYIQSNMCISYQSALKIIVCFLFVFLFLCVLFFSIEMNRTSLCFIIYIYIQLSYLYYSASYCIYRYNKLIFIFVRHFWITANCFKVFVRAYLRKNLLEIVL